MKALIIELRLYLAEKLLGWTLSVAPDNSEGKNIKKMIGHYFAIQVENKFYPAPCDCIKNAKFTVYGKMFRCEGCGKLHNKLEL